MKHYGRRWVSFVWRGDTRWVHSNLYRVPRFYGVTLGWIAIGLTIWENTLPASTAGTRDSGADPEGGVQEGLGKGIGDVGDPTGLQRGG